jgi:hypothetical protein
MMLTITILLMNLYPSQVMQAQTLQAPANACPPSPPQALVTLDMKDPGLNNDAGQGLNGVFQVSSGDTPAQTCIQACTTDQLVSAMGPVPQPAAGQANTQQTFQAAAANDTQIANNMADIVSQCQAAVAGCENLNPVNKSEASEPNNVHKKKNLALLQNQSGIPYYCNQFTAITTAAKNAEAAYQAAATQATTIANNLASNLTPNNPTTAQRVTPAATPSPSQGWWGRNEDWLIAGGVGLAAGGVAAYFITANNDRSSSSTTTPVTAAEASASAGFTSSSVDCTVSTNFSNQNCVNSYTQTCQSSPTAANCQLFTDSYCGLGNGTDAGQGIVPNGSGPGQSTAFCANMEAWRYCQTAGRSQCPSCLQIQMQQSAVCASNPTVCSSTLTQTQINADKANCPTDPYYTNNTSSTSGTTGTTGSTMSTSTAGSGFSTASVVGYGGSNANNFNPVLDPQRATMLGYGSSLNSGTRTPASTNFVQPYLGNQSEISNSVGKSIFQKNSSATQLWCTSVVCE